MTLAVSFIISIILIATFETVVFLYAPTPDIVPVPLLASRADPCGPNSEWIVASMPSARYTARARAHGIAGTVILLVYVMEDGTVSRASVGSALPLGLTDEAIRATSQIKFKSSSSCRSPGVQPVEIHYDFPAGTGKAIHL